MSFSLWHLYAILICLAFSAVLLVCDELEAPVDHRFIVIASAVFSFYIGYMLNA